MRIVQINTADRGGGAEGSAWNLFSRFRSLGHDSKLVVGRKYSQDADVIEIPRKAHWTGRPWQCLANAARSREGSLPGMRFLARCFDRLANPSRLIDWWNGRDEWTFPGCAQLPQIIGNKTDIIHCHNLHGWYFDLRVLPELAKIAPIVLNLRDTWALTGHCAYFIDCDHWKSGCGNCPRLNVYPAVRKDNTAWNWQRKAAIFKVSKLHVTAPSQWLLDRAKESMLNAVEYKLIPNGIDTTVFTPGDSVAARQELSLPLDAKIVMFAAAAKSSYFKDPDTLWSGVKRLATLDPNLFFLCVGMELTSEINGIHAKGIPYVSDARQMAQYYRSANVFLHTAKAEAFGKTVTEAMACGTPVVASATGGLVEQIIDGQTGLLFPTGDAEALAQAALRILNLPSEEYAAMQSTAAKRGASFSLTRQTEQFINWYNEIISQKL
ncbi:MAG: glycosyltransferase [Victivallales bacterium]|nr:glycosyltransferase [Victivallales bacterium]